MKLLIFLLITTTTGWAQLTPRNLLATRYPVSSVQAALMPRANWKPYPNTPEAWRQALPDSVRTGLVRAGERAANEPFTPLTATLTLDYVRNTNRTRYEAVSFGRRHTLMDLVLAESVEGQGRFTDAILNMVWAICEESGWGVPAHLGGQKTGNGLFNVEDRTVDLFGAETAAVLALTDYFVGDQLAKASPLVRPRIYLETNERLFKPIQESNRYGWLNPAAKVNNWNPWIMANWLTATLLLDPDESCRQQMTFAAMKGLDIYLNGLGENGGCDEGPSYWFAAGACVFDALELLHSATDGKVNMYREPLIRNIASYVYKMHIAGAYFVPFADADPTLTPDGLMLYRFGQQIQDDTLSRFGRWAYRTFGYSESSSNTHRSRGFHRQRKINNLLTIRQMKAGDDFFEPVRDVWFPDVQVMTARSPRGLYVAAHGGHNAESHNHNDVGDFILYANGKPVIIDAGRGTYTAKTFSSKRYELWWTQSQYHNLPIINGVGQPVGRACEARNVRYAADARKATLSMDLTRAYPAEAGIQSWNRTIALNRVAESLTLTDAYVLKTGPSSLQQAFLTTCTTDTNTPGQLLLTTPDRSTTVRLQYDPKRWSVAVAPVTLTMPDDEGFINKWPNQTIQRVLLTARQPGANGQSVFTFSLR
ncbi:heparinase II/III domain-containing protein [Spirosoma montaniterrae]|uniref:Heparinase II/III-like C-terminal domain-containing protein n=1 Tax=Spirosoma montaniterrae TaxID=1178516 RepID=A0A1P9WX27_9BACT|nr:heparinase II/III family protein [Spirosoma montaniterrae]AQG79942.1 hypothetical protein AWR27_11770 [Spirosoma montaniterrae]